jgi:copper transport protein
MAAMSARRIRRLFLLAALVASAYPSAASAHATLVRASPADGAVLGRAPAAVRLVFDDPVQPVGGSDVVVNATGRSVLAGSPRTAARGRTLVLPLRPGLRGGDYSVRWRILSDDGHLESGTLAFAVGAGRGRPRSILSAGDGAPRAEDVTARWLLFAGLFAASGTALFHLLVLAPLLRREPPERAARAAEAALPRLVALVFAGSLLVAVAAADFARTAGSETRFGLAMHVGAPLAAVAAGAALLALARPRAWPLAAALPLALLPIPAVAGHALDAGVPWPNVLVDLAHLTAAAAWIGGLAALLLVAPAAGGGALGKEVVRRFSALALGAVALLVATGVVRAVYELRGVAQLWDTGYGRSLLAKSALLAALVALGWTSRRRLADVRRVRRIVAAELALASGLVLAVALLTQLRPGRDVPESALVPAAAHPAAGQAQPLPPPPPAGALVLAREHGGDAVALALTPATATAIVLDPGGGGADGLAVRIDGRAAARCGHGCYRVPAPSPRRDRVDVSFGGQTTTFALPRETRPGGALIARATRAYLALRSVAYLERLSSGPGNTIVTRVGAEAPDRLAYRIAGGPDAVVVGARRWDSLGGGGRWRRSEASPLEVPQPVWGDAHADAHVVGGDRRTVVVTWADLQIPAFFEARFDRSTMLPLTLRMTAAAHFMHHRYLAFNRAPSIRPPAP